MVIILEEFFIRFTSSSINFFIRIIDFIISVLDKFEGNSNLGGEKNSKEKNFENNEIFKINNFLKNDSIFEELENRYSNSSSSNLSNSSNQAQNIFTSLNLENNDDYQNINESDDNFGSIRDKFIDILMNNKFISIDESQNNDSCQCS